MDRSTIKKKIEFPTFDELLDFVDEVSMVGATQEEIEAKLGHPFFHKVLPKLRKGTDLSKIIRDEVNTRVIPVLSKEELQEIDDKELLTKRKYELYGILDNIDALTDGQSVEEVVAFFTSMHDIVCLLCIQQTEGVVVAKVRLQDFFDHIDVAQAIPREFTQEASLIFSKDEINALHGKMPDIPDNDPYKPLFSAILDQSYDMVLFNELSGRLLIYMTEYFIQKLKSKGYGTDPKVLEFTERYLRTKDAFFKSLSDLKELESVINQHLENFPVLNDFPKYLRMILQIKAGLMDSHYLPKMLMMIKKRNVEYVKASRTTAFDFNKLPRYQHEIQIKQAIVISLQKETLQYTMKYLEEDLKEAKHDLSRLIDEVEVMSEMMDPNSADFKTMMTRKSKALARVEDSKKELDVVRSQVNLVNVQQTMIKKAIQRYKDREKSMAKEKEIVPVKKIQTATNTGPKRKKIPQRMVMARRLRGS